MEHRRRLPHVLGCGDGVDCHTAALARSSCVWAPSTNATHRGVLAGAASIRHRRPRRPDRQPSSDGVDSRCPCRSLRINSWPRRCSSRSRSLSLICWASAEQRKALASAKAASAAAHGVWPGDAALWATARIAQHSRNRCFARPENLGVAAAIAGMSPFPARHRIKTPCECPGGLRRRETRARRRRDQAERLPESSAWRRWPEAVPGQRAPKREPPRA